LTIQPPPFGGASRSAEPSDSPRSTVHAALDAIRTGEIETDGDVDAMSEFIGNVAERQPDTLKQALSDMAAAGGGRMAGSTVSGQWLTCAVAGPAGVGYADRGFEIGARDDGAREVITQLKELARQAMKGKRVFAIQAVSAKRRVLAVAAPAQLASNWPMPQAARAALSLPGMAAIMVFSPSHSEGFTGSIERMFDLTPAEARVCAVLFQADTVREAAAELGISEATAREHLAAILRKTGSARRAGLIARVTEVMAGDYTRGRDRKDVLREAFGLTLAEARVADAAARGLTAPEIATLNTVSVHTVRAQLDTALIKTGVRRATDLARIVCELSVLETWSSCDDAQRSNQETLIRATRIIPAGTRQIAATDYGPPGGAPVMFFHAGYRYRWIRRRLQDEMLSRGMRAVSFDLPNCGLTDPSPGRTLFEAAADDACSVLDRLKIGKVSLYAEFGGAMSAIAFAARRPDMINKAVLLMPRPVRQEMVFPTAMQRVYRALVANPDLERRFYETLRLRGGSRFWAFLQRQNSKQVAADREAMADPNFVAERLGEITAAFARTADGMLAFDHAHRSGWQPPGPVGGSSWTVVHTALKPFGGNEPPEQVWGFLPGLRLVTLETAGRLADHTHAKEIAALFD
jgi:DNA-binding CsgD family transcriptional regulator/pimeloyl-ACP methyl ester carboxylesterase